jgi:hypothetical protein
MSFEIPPDHIERFLRLLVDTLEVEQVTISFKREGGSLVESTYQPETLEVGLSDIEPYLVDPSFLMEFEGGALYTGGGGCFSLRALLTPAQVQRLIGGVLSLSGFDMYQHKGTAGMALFDGRVVVYR